VARNCVWPCARDSLYDESFAETDQGGSLGGWTNWLVGMIYSCMQSKHASSSSIQRHLPWATRNISGSIKSNPIQSNCCPVAIRKEGKPENYPVLKLVITFQSNRGYLISTLFTQIRSRIIRVPFPLLYFFSIFRHAPHLDQPNEPHALPGAHRNGNSAEITERTVNQYIQRGKWPAALITRLLPTLAL
jgi:hypothetical protein